MPESWKKLLDYYKTDHWRNLSEQTRKRINRCQLDANHPGPLHVHHNSYARLGSEDPLDLIVLCHMCHFKVAHPDHEDEEDMIDLNARNTSTVLAAALDAAIKASNERQPKRNYLGASRLGDPCARKLQYEYFHATPDKGFSGNTLRIFHRGHQGESWMIGWLRSAGFILRTEGKDGKQFGFEVAGGRIAGHADGVFIDGPEGWGPFPRLWENKVLGAKGWNKVSKEKVKKAYPVYYAQIQLYQAYLKLSENPAVFTALNADTMEVYAEEVEFDPKEAQAISDRAVMILKACDAGELLPRLSDDPAWFECKWCDYLQRCHYGNN